MAWRWATGLPRSPWAPRPGTSSPRRAASARHARELPVLVARRRQAEFVKASDAGITEPAHERRVAIGTLAFEVGKQFQEGALGRRLKSHRAHAGCNSFWYCSIQP